MENRLIKLDNLERYLIDNIHLDITEIQNKIVDIKCYIFSLSVKEIKDKKILNKIDEDIKNIECMMNDLGIDFKEKLKNNEHYNSIVRDILSKLFYCRNKILSKYTSYERLDLVGVDENIKYLINYIVCLNQRLFDEKETAEETINKIKKDVAEIDTIIKKLES